MICKVCNYSGEFTEIRIRDTNTTKIYDFTISNPKRNMPFNNNYEYVDNRRLLTVDLYACPECGTVRMDK